MYKSYYPKAADLQPEWLLVDATDKVLGRLASKLATVLMGKHKPTYTAHVDTGDFVIVVNADKIQVTGNNLSNAATPGYTRQVATMIPAFDSRSGSVFLGRGVEVAAV